MRIAVTGSAGFLGWHVRCSALAAGVECVPVDRATMGDPDRLQAALKGAGAVLHCAGVNRGSDADVAEGNAWLARQLGEAVERVGHPVRVVYANSVHARGGGAYGEGKRHAAELLEKVACTSGGFSDVLLPNLYGEHGRPHYNSFVATFCHEVAHGREPDLANDREIPLLHAQDAAAVLLREATRTGSTVVRPRGEPVSVSDVLGQLHTFEAVYRSGELPDIASPFSARLFNTYRSHLFPARYPLRVPPRSDARGRLVECVRTGYAGGQAFVSTTEPGAVRGNHFHLRKLERFLVVEGDAEIALRRLFYDRVVRFRVSGASPGIVDMPTMWVHNLANVGDRPVTTFFWTNELFSPGDADTFADVVDRRESTPGATA
ncbi:MAG: NAD-dependent epimerase/dehydratase family protein [Carbonactinosporaceae bacterium]